MNKNNNYYSNIRFDALSILPNHFSPTYVLEIGGGEFHTLKYISEKYNAHATGVDLYNNNANNNIIFINGSIEDKNIICKLENNKYDLIIANDVVEHLGDTELFFQTITDKLHPNGYALISVPNIRQIRSLWHIFIKGTFPRQQAGLFDSTHLRWFCKNDIINIAKKHGLKSVDHTYLGRLVPKLFDKSYIFEFFALQNLFLFKKG
jgi:2-polyprenyl-3-methyl-5-hydroxy-6-metoxy-1,4-benzoquinol methylase